MDRVTATIAAQGLEQLLEALLAEARRRVKRPPVTFEYRGHSYEEASRMAQAICRAAGESGETINAAKHLAELHAVMELAREQD